MSFPSILLLALGLAMDATAVSAARGVAVSRVLPRHVLLVAGFFGGFQAAMPLVGWLVGAHVGAWVQAWDHWIAFALLAAIGGKMIWEARQSDDDEPPRDADLFGWKVMTVLGTKFFSLGISRVRMVPVAVRTSKRTNSNGSKVGFSPVRNRSKSNVTSSPGRNPMRS